MISDKFDILSYFTWLIFLQENLFISLIIEYQIYSTYKLS